MSLRRPRFKIVLIGDAKSGKRKLLERYINGSFDYEMSTEFYQSAFKKGNVTTSVSLINWTVAYFAGTGQWTL